MSNPKQSIVELNFQRSMASERIWISTSYQKKQHTNPIKGNTEKPHIGQSRAGMKRRRPSPINQTITQLSELSQKIPGAAEIETRITNCVNSKAPAHSVNNTNDRMTQRRPLPTDVPFYPGPTYRSYSTQTN